MHLGDDIASLIVDGTRAEKIDEYYQRLLPAYLQGFSESVNLSHILHMRDMILYKFGYGLLQEYIFSPHTDAKKEALRVLGKIHQWG